MPQPRHATPPASPFAVLGLTPDADLAAVRRAFRSAALDTHPDRGGDAAAFRSARAAYDRLRTSAGLARERARWAPLPPLRWAPDDWTPPGYTPPPRRPTTTSPGVLFTFGNPTPPTLDTAAFPPAPAKPGGSGGVTFDLDARPPGWKPGTAAPPFGACLVAVDGPTGPSFGVWTALDGGTLRAVFGPHPANLRGAR